MGLGEGIDTKKHQENSRWMKTLFILIVAEYIMRNAGLEEAQASPINFLQFCKQSLADGHLLLQDSRREED